ncbi:RING-type E3 ubiquitin-protein ligase PPIL2-like [Oppia nitens]|uniref:RING-type E3 ubiquitin-protein ligase PPIL2-like n=1 Tax=Oppia nitens TaxID=1686743 RepID=UPI0023DAC4A0|nr:RING-type E3 ubiquitin-protein ligase PPIL2-like [Oppia nitens]
MGKKQHQKDKLYLTSTEWSTIYGGRTALQNLMDATSDQQFRRLPLDHCSLSMQPFSHPYCNQSGVIYDLQNIVPFIKKYGIDPFDGQKMDMKSLVKLNFHLNNDGQRHCPVLYKVFTQNSHLVAIRTTGNVFSYEAVQELNLKAKHMKDLVSDEPFTKKDIITIQDPKDISKFNITNFYHIRNQLSLVDSDDEDKKDSKLRFVNNETKATLKELSELEEKTKKKSDKNLDKSKDTKAVAVKGDKFNSAHYSTGAVAASFTSTAMDPVWSKLEPAILTDDAILYPKIKKKGYVRFVTNFGDLNLELYCDQTPKTCHNFLKLCKSEYYNDNIFHRLIKNFMIQSGDPTGTGKGGQSAFGQPFDDEIKPQFSHEGRGVLSMANSGPNTNKSQFFITFRSCKHLDKKHTIFGRVVGGLEVLDKMERTKTDAKDRPLDEIKILRTPIFVDPFQEIEDQISKEREEMDGEEKRNKEKELRAKSRTTTQELKPIRKGIGAFIDLSVLNAQTSSSDTNTTTTTNNNNTNNDYYEGSEQPKKKKLSHGGTVGFGNFSNW